MGKNLHNESFDELIRSKYRDEKAQPEARLWKNIQSRLPSAPLPMKPWYLSKTILIGASVIAALGIVVILLYQFYLKADTDMFNRLSLNKENPINNQAKDKKATKNVFPLKAIGQKSNSPAHILLPLKKTKSFPLQYRKNHLAESTKKNIVKQFTNNTIHNTSSQLKNGLATYGFIHRGKNITPLMTSKITLFLINQPINHKLHTIHPRKKMPAGLKTKAGSRKKKRKKKKASVQHPWSLEVYLLPEYSYRTLAPNPAYTKGIFTTSYFNKRDQYKFTYSYGLLVDYRFLPKFSIESGLAYYSYELGFSALGTDLIKKDNHHAIVYTSSGAVVLNIENADSLNTKTLLKSSIGIHYISIPVNLKYYPFKNLFINAGTTIDYNFSQTLNWEEENENGNFNVESGDLRGIKQFNISLILGLGYEQTIFRNLSFSINPGIRIHLINLNQQGTVKTYPYHAGFKISLRYEF